LPYYSSPLESMRRKNSSNYLVCFGLLLTAIGNASSDSSNVVASALKNCYIADKDMEARYLAAAKTLKGLEDDKDVLSFAKDNTCNPFIRASLKIDFLKSHVGSSLFSFADIQSDIDLIDAIPLKMQSIVGMGELSMVAQDLTKAHEYANKAKTLVSSVQLISNTAYSAIFRLSNLYATLGDFNTAYSIAEKLNGDEKEALLFKLNQIRLRKGL